MGSVVAGGGFQRGGVEPSVEPGVELGGGGLLQAGVNPERQKAETAVQQAAKRAASITASER